MKGNKRTLLALLCVFIFLLTLKSAGARELDWVNSARIGGLGLHLTITDAELETALDSFVRQGVNVVEADTDLSDYMNHEEFKRQTDFIEKVVKKAHAKGLKVVWYFPTLEVITPDGALEPHSMQKDHPRWVQRNFDRETFNYFYGTKVFWVEPNDESAWMCPNSPYGEYYYERIEKLAGTGIDGLWLDVPLFNSIVGKWPCSNTYCITKFEKETSMSFPEKLDFEDPAFRRWLLWRHKTLAEFLEGVDRRAKKVNPDIRTIVEVVSTDHLINTLEGLDTTYFNRDLDIVWEVDAISDTTSMKDARESDWLSMFIAYKYSRGIAQERGCWAFSYGYEENDAQLVMASLLSAQCNPYETRIPKMVTSVGKDFRTRMFKWIDKNSGYIFGSDSTAETGLLYSPNTRDFTDGHLNGGFYLTYPPPSPSYRWWVKSPRDSVRFTNYLSEYRGWGIFLIKNRIPFDILSVNQITPEKLDKFKALILPQAKSMSDTEKKALLGFVEKGGSLIVTGKENIYWDEMGVAMKTGLWEGIKKESNSTAVYGKGKLFFVDDLFGQKYLRSGDEALVTASLSLLEKAGISPLITGKGVYVQSYSRGDDIVIHLLHYGWVDKESKAPFSVKSEISIPWSENSRVESITQSAPGWETPKEILEYNETETLNFTVETNINSLVIIKKKR